MIHVVDTAPDIADRLETEAIDADEFHPSVINIDVLTKAAKLIRDLDKAISHALAVHGTCGLSPWARSVLTEAVTRQQRRGDGIVR